jgi:hypothetical protein
MTIRLAILDDALRSADKHLLFTIAYGLHLGSIEHPTESDQGKGQDRRVQQG